MDWKTFIATLVSSLAWPIVIGGFVYFFRHPIKNRLNNLKSFRHGSTSIEFSAEVEKLEKKAEIEFPQHKKYRDKTTEENIIELIKLSPRAAILESWIFLEGVVKKILESEGVGTRPNNIMLLKNQALLYDKKYLNRGEWDVLQELRNLRNSAAHYTDNEFYANESAIKDYVQITLRMANYLNSKFEGQAVRPTSEP